jgi:Protein of unknown function (DUF3000)
MTARRDLDDPPLSFTSALSALRSARLRPEIVLDEAPAPQRLAPHAVALTAEVVDIGGDEIGSGRLVLLHDPMGHDTWDGTFRVVTFARASVEAELAADPLAHEVAWSWLIEALEHRNAAYTALGGTVTRVSSESFGALGDRGSEAQIEVRASWTPVDTPDRIGAHIEAWGDLLATGAGLAPLPEGVLALPTQRSRRR